MKPNIIYVFPDEFRPYSMGFLGKEKVFTPNLDKLATEGTTCSNVISNFPVCSPYRGILMSGKYPYKNGVTTNCNSGSTSSLKDDLYCLPDCLSDEGYDTAYIGKWHLDSPKPGDEIHGEGRREDGLVWDCYTPPGKGRHSFDFWYSYGCCDEHNNPHYWTGDKPRTDSIKVNKWSAIHETDIAIEYIENRNNNRKKDSPFALFLAYNPPHMPFDEVPKKYKKRYKNFSPDDLLIWDNINEEGRGKALPHVKNYYSMITGIDDQFGRVMDTLKEQGLEENTVVIFTSDHGEMMGSQGFMGKHVWYNESVLVPFIIKYPGKIREGIIDDMLFSTVDHYKTITGLLNIDSDKLRDLDGTDVSERLITGHGKEVKSSLYMNIDHLDSTNGSRGIKTETYTFVFNKTCNNITWYCYNNIKDPSQLFNIYGDDKNRDYRLKKELIQKLIDANDPFFYYSF